MKEVVPKPPNPPRLVNDFAGVIDPGTEAQLERMLVAYDDSTSNQIAIVTISTIGDNAIEDVGLEILRQWGVGGQSKKDNGIVILAAVKDRRVTISTGYGMEGALPDFIVKRIIENDILPLFKGGDYGGGFAAGVQSIMRAAAGEYQAPANYRNRGSGGGISIGTIIIAFIILMVVLNFFKGGGGGGGFVSRRGYRGFSGPIFLPGGFGGGGGGFGGGGGGGFGGFGGGSGGGGGASGSW